MEILKEPKPYNRDETVSRLKSKFPGYAFSGKTDRLIIASKSKLIGANIILGFESISVKGNFPSIGTQFLFTFFTLMLGVIIPIIIYFVYFKKEFKAFEAEIGEYLNTEYGKNIKGI
jgi:hypothetical protein